MALTPEEIHQEYKDARDVYSRDPRWPTNIAPERWEAFPTFEEWALREYNIVTERS